jgi:hypothetical protein
MHPTRLQLPSHPTEVNLTPWNSLTVVILGTSLDGTGATKKLAVKTIETAARSQIFGAVSPPTVTSVLSCRFKSVRVWGPSPTKDTPLRVTFCDVFDDNVVGGNQGGVLQRCVNYADAVNRARVGFRYSVAQQNYAVVTVFTNEQPVAYISAGNPADLDSVVVYVDLLWRFSNFSDAVEFPGPESSSLEDLTELPGDAACPNEPVGRRPGPAVPRKWSGKQWYNY